MHASLSLPFSITDFPFRIDLTTTLGKSRNSISSPIASLLCSSRSDQSKPEFRMFVLGMGFVGQFFGQELKKEGWDVSSTCTTVVKKNELENRGFDVHLFNAMKPEQSTLLTIKYHSHLLVSIPPILGIGDPVLQHGELLRQELLEGNLQWLCYLSSTSVYGHCDGALVEEDYPARPSSELAKMRLDAEKGWLSLGHDLGLSAQVFRLGGIYGPGRSAVDTIVKQEPLLEGQKMRASRQFTSRVHVEDIYQSLKAAICMPSTGKIYNIVDDDPAPREEVFRYALELIEGKWPGYIKQAAAYSMTEPRVEKGSLREDKRVSNARVKKELGLRLLHPSYKSGLQSIIDQMDTPSCYNREFKPSR